MTSVAAPHHSLCLRADEAVLQAIDKLETSRLQIAFIVDEADKLLGVVTNGDIRRHLLEGGKTDDSVSACMNASFRAAKHTASREELLKLLDLGFNAIPLVDRSGRLVDVVTPQSLSASPEVPVLVRSRAPVRVSFAGGGSDLTYFFVDHPGAVLSTTISLFCHVTLIPRDDKQIILHSEDLSTTQHYASLSDLEAHADPHGLLEATILVVRPSYGFDLYVRSDFPVGSGLGGSSAVTTAIVAAFNEFRLDRWTAYEIAEICFQAERLCFGVAGGWQDQYASAFGGFNLMEFDGSRNLVHPLRLEGHLLCELEECLVLCDTQISHNSGKLHEEQREAFDMEKKAAELKEVVNLCRKMHHHLTRGEILEFGRDLHTVWQLKRGLSASISSDKIDRLYTAAMSCGALGGKLLGAGGGGFMLFFVPPQYRSAVTNALTADGCRIFPFQFEAQGVVSWKTKIS